MVTMLEETYLTTFGPWHGKILQQCDMVTFKKVQKKKTNHEQHLQRLEISERAILNRGAKFKKPNLEEVEQ